MPESKSRHAHKHAHHHEKQDTAAHKHGSNNRIVTIATIFFAVLGLGVGFLVDAGNVVVLLVGLVLGLVVGYFAGQQFKKSLSGK